MSSPQLLLVDNPKHAPAFDQFWNAYPAKKNKGEARKAWWDVRNIIPPLPELLAIIDRQKKTRQWQLGYIPDPHRWLRGERWEDEEPAMVSEAQLAEKQAAEARKRAEDSRKRWEALSPDDRLREINARVRR